MVVPNLGVMCLRNDVFVNALKAEEKLLVAAKIFFK